MSPRHRLTVSLLVTGEVATEIDGMRRALGAGALHRIAPHITLVPPVNVRDDELQPALDVVRGAAGEAAPLRCALGPPATFWPATPVVYLAVHGDLDSLRALRTDALAGPLVAEHRTSEREFVPHVTLDQNIEPERIPAALETLSSYRADVTFTEVTVLEFAEDTRHWEPIASYGLGRPRIVGRGGIEVELSVSSSQAPDAAAFQRREWAQYSREAYGEGTEHDEPFAVTARVAGEIVGTATGTLTRLVCRLGILVVAEHCRGQGIGSRVLRTVEDFARERGAQAVRLETRVGGPAESLYRQRGYEATAVLPRWREERDFVVMERRL